MNEAITFEAYLNKEKPSAGVILTAARFIANKWAAYRPTEALQKELCGGPSVPQLPDLIRCRGQPA